MLLGTPADLERARDFATRVQEVIGTQPKAGDYWLTATIGEVFLIQQQYQDAARLYRAAVAAARSEVGSHQTTWQQARRLLEKLKPAAEDRAAVRAAFAHLPDEAD